MPLTPFDPTEDRHFAIGETVFDVDGNAFTVAPGLVAVLNLNDNIRYDLTPEMAKCFSRRDPKKRPSPQSSIARLELLRAIAGTDFKAMSRSDHYGFLGAAEDALMAETPESLARAAVPFIFRPEGERALEGFVKAFTGGAAVFSADVDDREKGTILELYPLHPGTDEVFGWNAIAITFNVDVR